MAFVRELAVSEHLIVLATIHQPSTRIYLGFDRVMLLSEGRVAFSGRADAAVAHFEGLGHALPPLTNPADWLLDLVNADFADAAAVARLLDAWAAARRDEALDGGAAGVDDEWGVEPTLAKQLVPQLRRQAWLLSRDVLLWVRACCFLVGNLYFAVVYIKARDRRQDQILSRMWLNVWYVAVPSMVTCLLVFALNFESRLVRTEAANGMVSPTAYLVARSLLEIPIVVVFTLFALGIPAFAVAKYHAEDNRFLTTSFVWLCQAYCWDAYAAAAAVAFESPLIGVAVFIGCWFSGFLYGGFLIPIEDIVWPLRALHSVWKPTTGSGRPKQP